METKANAHLLTIKEAAAFLNLKESRLRTAIFKKEVPFFKIGALVRLCAEDLLEWLETKKVLSSP